MNDTAGQLAYAEVKLVELREDVSAGAVTDTNVVNRIRAVQKYLAETIIKLKDQEGK